jgi:hypothetical protein
MVNQLVGKAEAMIRANHFAGEDIQDTVRHLKEGYAQLRDLAALRKLRLSDAVESQQFFFRLNDTADWIKVRGRETRVEILVYFYGSKYALNFICLFRSRFGYELFNEKPNFYKKFLLNICQIYTNKE